MPSLAFLSPRIVAAIARRRSYVSSATRNVEDAVAGLQAGRFKELWNTPSSHFSKMAMVGKHDGISDPARMLQFPKSFQCGHLGVLPIA
jgi:hypothetical protein